MVKHLSILIFGCLIFLSLAHVYPSFTNLQFDGRSGDIIIGKKNNAEVQLSWDPQQSQLRDIQMYNMYARLFKVPRMIDSLEVFIPTDLFNRPKGNLLFSIEGLSAKQVSDAKILGTGSVKDLYQDYNQPWTPYSMIATAVTGVDPYIHGFVNKRWPALQNEDEMYAVANIFDHLLQYHSSESSMVSASSNRYAATALSPHKDVAAYSQVSETLHWDHVNAAFYPSTSKYSISLINFPSLILKLANLVSFPLTYNDKESVVSVGGKDPVSYDLLEEAYETLFAELLFVVNTASLENAPQFFSFHFQSLKMISLQFGELSKEYKTAVALVDAVIAHAINNYGQEYTHTIYYFPTIPGEQEVEALVSSVVLEYTETETGISPESTFSDFYPHVYLTSEGKNRKTEICTQIQTSMNNLPSEKRADIHCADSIEAHQKRALMQSPIPPNQTPQAEIAGWHVVVWMSVALVFILLTAIWYLFTMDVGEDSLLFYKSKMAMNKGLKGNKGGEVNKL